MLQKYCACHEKVEPRHTKSCHAKWSLQSNTSVTWNLQPFHTFSVECFKHRHHKPQNPYACHAKPIVSDPLQIHRARQRFCDPDELLRLPRILQRVEIPAPATRNKLSTSKNVPSPWCFNDFDFRIVRARRRGANFGKLNFQKCSEHAAWCFFRTNRSRAQAWCKFCRYQLPKVLRACQFLTISTSKSVSRAGVVQILSTSWTADPSQLPFFGPTFASLRSDKAMEKHSISRNSYPPKHLCCENIDAGRATGNFQYSRKLELLNFLWLWTNNGKQNMHSNGKNI